MVTVGAIAKAFHAAERRSIRLRKGKGILVHDNRGKENWKVDEPRISSYGHGSIERIVGTWVFSVLPAHNRGIAVARMMDGWMMSTTLFSSAKLRSAMGIAC